MTATIDVDAPTHSLWDARLLIPPDVFAGDSRNSHRGHPTGATDAPSTQMFDNKVRRRLANCLDDTSDATTPTEWRQRIRDAMKLLDEASWDVDHEMRGRAATSSRDSKLSHTRFDDSEGAVGGISHHTLSSTVDKLHHPDIAHRSDTLHSISRTMGTGSLSGERTNHASPDRAPDRDRASKSHCQRRTRRSSSSEDDYSPRRRIKVREFDGKGSFETFYEHFQVCAEYNRWREVDRLAHLKSALVGDAGQLLWDTPSTETDTVAKLAQLLRNRFGGVKQIDKFRMELRLRRRQPGETLSQLHQSIRCLMALAHPTLKADEREAIACDYYVDALDDPDFALKVRTRTNDAR